MALKPAAVIDMIIDMSASEPHVGLVIVDNGDIPDPAERMLALRRKLTFYLYYGYSDDIVPSDPKLKGAKASIEVICMSLPPTEEMRLIESVAKPGPPRVELPVRVWSEAEFMAELARIKETSKV
jgi:hypothetical protein